jgi:hypothetical protein
VTPLEPNGSIRRPNGVMKIRAGLVRGAAVAILAAAALPVTGCAGGQERVVAADCSARVRLDGRIYNEGGYVARGAARLGVADEAACHDVGDDPEGSLFLDHPRQVVVWAFPGFAPEEVLGVRIDEETLRVFVLESFPRADVDKIVKELRQSPR